MSGGSLAGVFGLVQMYKQEKISSDYRLINLSNEITDAAYDKVNVSNIFIEADTKLREQRDKNKADGDGSTGYSDTVIYDFELPNGEVVDQATYDDIYKELTALKDKALAEVAADEQEWQSKWNKENAKNSMLQANIQSYEAMLQGNIQGNFTYGYQQ